MTDDQRHLRNLERLAECYSVFARRAQAVINGLEAQQERPRAQDAWRSPAEQRAKYQAGRSKVQWGFHCATADDGHKEALAIDLVDDDDANDDGDLNFSRGLGYAFLLARLARVHKLSTGIDWGLPEPIRGGLWRAIESHDLTWPIKNLGWDPCHLEPSDLTVRAARRGLRPTA